MNARKSRDLTPLWIRVWHWIVAILFLVLVFTGIVLTYSSAEFAMMDYKLATDLHDIAGIALAVFYGIFLVMLMATGYWRKYMRRWRGLFKRLKRQIVFVASWTPSPPGHKRRKHTRLDTIQPLIFLFQQFLYLTSVGIVLPLLIITGLFYLYPETAPAEVMGFAGLWPMAMAHYIAGLLGTAFIIFHMYIGTIRGLRRMITGYPSHVDHSVS